MFLKNLERHMQTCIKKNTSFYIFQYNIDWAYLSKSVIYLCILLFQYFLSTSFYLWTLVCLFPDVVNSYCNHSYYNHNNCRWVYQMLHIKHVIWTNWYSNSKEDPFILKKINVWIKPPQINLFINSNCVAKKWYVIWK